MSTKLPLLVSRSTLLVLQGADVQGGTLHCQDDAVVTLNSSESVKFLVHSTSRQAYWDCFRGSDSCPRWLAIICGNPLPSIP
ncbi:hypothetical protein E2C01_062758 [Portunus trituberculatus]|uniref:Uncharacterized protein n=1 Tax=Portunus trituberculatus TaxID=210409 RepID=A0A5B7HEY1_PORTR|nr:hypothetical protein [Portunus trituberculatus]